ncbi:YrdB family protein [Streptomyces sp. NPDC046371]|uniref:YrdB family protein n=1 Tax=unclassified Streptomyces TaxID=2593676 RepID=UPI0033D4E022
MKLPAPLHVLNETLAFLLELAALALLACWGWQTPESTVPRLLLAAAAPAAAATVWGLFAAPKARIRLPLAGVLGVKALVFGSATGALYALAGPGWALAFGVVATVNTALATLGRRGRGSGA